VDVAEISFPSDQVRPLLEAVEPLVLRPEQIKQISGAENAGVPLAVARLALTGGRLGCIVAAAPSADHEFPERKLRLLAGIADQATLALAR
jgi:hypothetical protein